MSKIIQAINAMTLHPDLISNVKAKENPAHPHMLPPELFFLYDKKHKWSLRENGNAYYLTYFKSDNTIESIMKYQDSDLDEFRTMIYKSDDFNGREVRASFQDLYRMLHEKAFGIDTVLDDIIGDTFAYGS